MNKIYLAIILLLTTVAPAMAKAPGSYPVDPFPDAVTTYTLGSGGGYGENNLPDNVLGPPHGNADSTNPEASATNLFSLGDGGSIILEFRDNVCVDRPGPDFAVFENVFAVTDYQGNYFIETAIVSVSDDGKNWVQFPCHFDPSADKNTPAAYSGFAGVQPTYASYDNAISPVDPAVSGGDLFDLADVGMKQIRFVKLQDTGIPGTSTETKDSDGNVIDDPGNGGFIPGGTKFGFDLDAVAAIHSAPHETAANGNWALYE